MPLIDLSHTIVPGMPQWRSDDQPLLIHRHSEHGADSHMSSSLEFGCHIGTHIDAPLHFRAGEPGVDLLDLERFSGPGAKVTFTSPAPCGPMAADVLDAVDPDGIDFILFETGWSIHWGTGRYYEDWPYLSVELAERLAAWNLKGVGLDTPSLDAFDGRAAHDIGAAAGMINIENLANLAALPPRGFHFQALPLKLHRTEASPVRAAAWLPEPTPERN